MAILSTSFRVTVLFSAALALNGCSGINFANPPANSLYCDNFLIYEMCARDSNRDGIVDYTYFQDSKKYSCTEKGCRGEYRRALECIAVPG